MINDFQFIRELKKDGAKVNPMKASKPIKCPYCGKWFVPKHHRTKFCSKKCYTNHRKEYKAKWFREKGENPTKLGTGYITGHANPDFEKEAQIVRNEKKRFRL